MATPTKPAVLLFVVCGLLVPQQLRSIQDTTDPLRARLSGSVLDELGKPAIGVTVQAMPPGVFFGTLPATQTDANGAFELAGLLPGHTRVTAFRERAFYSEISNLCDEPGGDAIELPTGGEIEGLVLTVRPSGRLHVEARDPAGAEIDLLDVRLECDGKPSAAIEGGTLGNSWVLPLKPVRICVSATGFEATWYGGNGTFSQSVPIALKPREVFTAATTLKTLSPGAVNSGCWSDPRR